MKFLISDYSSAENTEAMYFNTTLNTIGCASTLWKHDASAFDIFDITKPDIYLSHVGTFHNDTIIYLSQNKNIDLILNITGIKHEDLAKLDDILKHNNITPKFYFTNNPNHKYKSKNNIVTIQHGADIYFIDNNDLKYNIECGIFVNNASQMRPYGDTYHYLSNSKTMDGIVDIASPVINLSVIYKNYDKLIFRYFSEYFPQVFFDAAYYGKSVYIDHDSDDVKLALNKLFGEEGLCDLNKESGLVQNKIKAKHTCLHRVKSLISQLSTKDQLNNITKLIEEKLT